MRGAMFLYYYGLLGYVVMIEKHCSTEAGEKYYDAITFNKGKDNDY